MELDYGPENVRRPRGRELYMDLQPEDKTLDRRQSSNLFDFPRLVPLFGESNKFAWDGPAI